MSSCDEKGVTNPKEEGKFVVSGEEKKAH